MNEIDTMRYKLAKKAGHGLLDVHNYINFLEQQNAKFKLCLLKYASPDNWKNSDTELANIFCVDIGFAEAADCLKELEGE